MRLIFAALLAALVLALGSVAPASAAGVYDGKAGVLICFQALPADCIGACPGFPGAEACYTVTLPL